MKTSQLSVFAFFFVIAFGIYTSPTNDLLEITAQLCLFSPPKEKCFCSEEMDVTMAFLELYFEDKPKKRRVAAFKISIHSPAQCLLRHIWNIDQRSKKQGVEEKFICPIPGSSKIGVVYKRDHSSRSCLTYQN